MSFALKILSPFAVLALSSCGGMPDTGSSRFDSGQMNFAAQDATGATLDAQARELSDLSKRIVVQTTLEGAGIGAIVGCGMAVVSAGNASKCVAAAAVGAASGAVIGHQRGKRKVARQIEHVSPSAVVRTLRKSNDQMALVQRSLPARLEAQDAALARIDLQRATGAMDQRDYLTARAAITSERQALASALLETENHAHLAAANLRRAKSDGQAGLDWHISASEHLAREAVSARSSISLL